METTQDDALLNTLIDILRQSTAPEAQDARNLILRRIALAGDVTPSRLPAPLNITQLGGYINLLESLGASELRQRMLSAILGVALPETQARTFTTGPILFFTERQNDRPTGDQQAAIPLSFTLRSDFVKAFDIMLANLHAIGCMLPILTPARSLPSLESEQPSPRDLLTFIGRTLEFVPSSALIKPDTDTLVVGGPQGDQKIQLAARQVGPAATGSVSPVQILWQVWMWDATQSKMLSLPLSANLLPLEKVLNAVGWYNSSIRIPVSPVEQGDWNFWTNTTGLVVGVTRYGDELRLLYTPAEIANCGLREMLDWIWDGKNFIVK